MSSPLAVWSSGLVQMCYTVHRIRSRLWLVLFLYRWCETKVRVWFGSTYWRVSGKNAGTCRGYCLMFVVASRAECALRLPNVQPALEDSLATTFTYTEGFYRQIWWRWNVVGVRPDLFELIAKAGSAASEGEMQVHPHDEADAYQTR